MCRCMKHPPNHQDNNDEYNQTLYLSVILGFVIVPLLVWPTVVALAACIITLSFLGEILFSIPLMHRRISLLQLQLWLSAEYALFFCAMVGVGWQFAQNAT